MKRSQPLRIYSSLPWIIAFCALLTSVANLATGIVILATYITGGDIALGILTIVFAVWGMSGSILALVLIIRQNRYNRSQANFIAQVSHELRTPITSIRMYADTLSMHRYRDESERDELVKHMDEEITRLEHLTEQILEEISGKTIKDAHRIDLAKTLKAALQPFMDAPQNKDRLDVQIDEDLPRVRVDRDDFTNAASNIIRNALTHGGPGSVHVALKKELGKCKLVVRDEGTGIPKEWRKQIFEPFERGFNTTDSGIPGFGLGLSIVRDFVRQYKAEIKVDNHPEGGAVFTLIISP